MKIVCFSTLSTGLVPINYALESGVQISKIIGLNPESVNDLEKISGYVDIAEFCNTKGINYSYVDKYNLEGESPEDLLGSAEVVWANAWQRLLPIDFVNYPKLGVIGAHGSCDGITKGRGRSPQNWAILIGADNFKISLFRISEGIDNGAVITTEQFPIEINDTILTSYLKSGISCASGIKKITDNSELIDHAVPQLDNPEYFPKRVPDDGFIDWNMSVIDIYNQIRALSDPYPNARTILNGNTVLINKAMYLDYDLGCPGEIIYKYPTGEIVVACGKGSLIIEECNFEDHPNKPEINIGTLFESISMKLTVKNILDRFNSEFPSKELNKSLKSFWRERGLLDE